MSSLPESPIFDSSSSQESDADFNECLSQMLEERGTQSVSKVIVIDDDDHEELNQEDLVSDSVKNEEEGEEPNPNFQFLNLHGTFVKKTEMSAMSQ